MSGLIPRDLWEYGLGDLLHGLANGFIRKDAEGTLHIDGIGDCIPVRSGRAALVAALKALRLSVGARVGVPLYCCPVVFKAITAAGYKVRFVDIDAKTFCMSLDDLSAKRSELDAVIAIHTFGNVCDVSSVQAAVRGIPVIEDCAQALGSKLRNCAVGSFGTLSFFSFRSGKYISAGEGGALFSSDAEMYSLAARHVREMPAVDAKGEYAHVAKTYVKSLLRTKPLYGVVGYKLWKVLGRKMNLAEKSGISLSQIHPADLTTIRKRLPLLDSAIERQRANANFYSKTLKLESGMLCEEQPGTFRNAYCFPVTFPSTDHRDFMSAYLMRLKVDTIKYLDDIVDIATKDYGYEGDCDVAEQLSKRVLLIPNYSTLTSREVQRIAQCLNAGWVEARGRNVLGLAEAG